MAKATITMATGTFTGEGKDIDEALQNVQLDLLKIKTKGTVRVEDDGKAFETMFMLQPLRRLFRNKTAKTHWAHAVKRFLK